MIPAYKIGEWLPAMRDGARRLGLVTLAQMVRALVAAVENPPDRGKLRVVDVPGIRSARTPFE